jgi:uncharacterized membrane protein YkgB
MSKLLVKRALRVAAFALGAGIAGLGAGSVLGFSAVQSALFGSLLAVIGLIGALSFVFAVKGSVPDEDFDNAINSAVETVRSKTEKSK